MGKNQVQFQKGYSLVEFMNEYGTEDQCEKALFNLKWSNGFECPSCGASSYCKLKNRKHYQCNKCHHQTSLTSGTIFAHTKLPLRKWCLGIHLISQSKTSISALELKRQLDVNYDTAWMLKQKVMQVMKDRDDQSKLSGRIELDDVFWGGERRGGKRGRGSENKTPFVAAVACDEDGRPLKMKMNVLKSWSSNAIAKWAKANLQPRSHVISDGLACFNAVKEAGCSHTPIITGGGAACVKMPEFTWVNTMIANVKTALIGTCHAVRSSHLSRYLAEFCYRFNRRFQLRDMMPRLLYVALRTTPMPRKLLIMADLTG